MFGRRRMGCIELLKLLTFSVLGFSARSLFDTLGRQTLRPSCADCQVTKCATLKPENMDKLQGHDLARTRSGDIHEDFKPKTMYEMLRWTYFTEKHVYENLDDDPRIGLIGNYKLDVQDILSQAMVIVDGHDPDPSRYTLNRLVNGYRRVDALKGAEYILDLEVKNSVSRSLEERRVYLVKPFGEVSSPPRPFGEKSETVNFIISVSGLTDRFVTFMERYEETCIKGGENTSLLVVLFAADTADEQIAVDDVKSLMQQYQEDYPSALITYIETTGPFSRAVGLDVGVKQYPKDALLFLSDIDVDFDAGFLNRCRQNAVYRQLVYFPIVFSLYDPQLIYQDAEVPAEPSRDINKHNGFWVHYGYGMVCLHALDYHIVGGFDVTIRGWGGEDVDLYNRFIKSDIKVFRSVDPALTHRYHHKSCDPLLTSDQYRMCVGALAESIGSKSQLARKMLGLKVPKT